MANYLLLRNNKESGPYSVDQLMELGLKPYDLVWMQGKSAAWRYPSEVEELKPFAPIVEEQPYDRFYKKSGEEKKEESPKQVVQEVAPEYEKYIPKKSVFVTMPGQKTVAATFIKPTVKEETYIPPVSVQQTIIVKENPVAAQVKYSQPLDDIKEMYVKTLQDRKQKIARKGFWVESLKKAAVILLLVAVGVITGFVIKSNGNKKQEIVKGDKPVQSQPLASEPATDSKTDEGAVQQDQQIIPPPSGGYVNKEAEPLSKPVEIKEPANKPVINTTKKEAVAAPSENKVTDNQVSPPVDIDARTGERSRKVRDENSVSSNNVEEKKTFHATNNLSGQVSVTSNEYKKVAFGGIRNLELTVTNDSKYTLDNVTVELQYLKPSEQPLKTENIQFKSVGPKATSTVRVPDTNRGIKVVYRIITIKSRQMDDGVAGN
jgi:hypothetical protein